MDYTIRKFFKTFGFKSAKSAIALECYETNIQHNVGIFNENMVSKYTKTHQFIVEIPENILECLTVVNKMVKHDNCPNAIRNKFYHKKHQFIKYLYEHGLVTKVLESEKYYNFCIGDYSFHQMKECFKQMETVDGSEEYTPAEADISFNYSEYKKVMNGMFVFMMTNQTSLSDCTENYKYLTYGIVDKRKMISTEK